MLKQQSQLSMLWAARSVAVIGASARVGSTGRRPVEFLLRYGYSGRIIPVNPNAAVVLGIPTVPTVTAADAPVDLAMILVPAAKAAAALDDCIAAAVPVVVVCSAGFAETGADGQLLQAELVAKASAAGVRLVGPNCIGTVGIGTGQVASFSPLFDGEHTELVDGRIAFVSQSGALGYGAVSLAFERGLGLGWVVNTGNEADVTALEVMAELAEDPAVGAVLGYVEALSDVQALHRLAAAGKPVALLKAGTSASGAAAAASHTAALAAPDRVVDAALRRYGIVRAADIDELLDVGDAFASPRLPLGSRVAVVTTSGGSGILAADAIEQHGLVLADLSEQTTQALAQVVPSYGSVANPVDVTATVMADPRLFDACLDLLVADAGVDIVVACFCVLTGQEVDSIVSALSRVAEGSGKPVLVARTGAHHLAPQAAPALRAAGIPAYATPARAVRAAAALWQFASAPPRGTTSVTRTIPTPVPGIGEAELKDLLAAAGFPVPARTVVRTRAEATSAVEVLGGRAVLKALVPGLVHKTEAGGVLLDVSTARAAEVYDTLARLGGDVLVEEQVIGGVEMLVGIVPSPLGPMLTLGLGGELAELLDDVALSPLPVDRAAVQAMLDRTRAGRMLAGFRGRPAADVDALIELLIQLGDGVSQWPDAFELDLNPVVVLPAGQGVRILDAAYLTPQES